MPIPGVAEELARADAALAAGDTVACGDALGRAYLHLRKLRHSVPLADVYDAGRRIVLASLGGWVPAMLAHAGNVRDDQQRWGCYLVARRAILTAREAAEVLLEGEREHLDNLHAYYGPLLEAIDLAIGAALA